MNGGYKCKRLNLRVTEKDYEVLLEKSRLCGMTISEYMRNCSIAEDRLVIIDSQGQIGRLLGYIYHTLDKSNVLTVDEKSEIGNGLSDIVITINKAIEELK